MDLQIKQAQKLLYKYITLKKPFFLHGTMGIGKSDAVRAVTRQIAEEKKMKYNEGQYKKNAFNLVDIRVSQLDPSDLRGIPTPDGNQTKWLIPSWLPTEGEGVIFFDELNLSPQSIQASCYQLILDRRLGDYVLPDGWTIIAAGNRASDKANVFPMPAPLKNRFGHATLLVPSDEEWRDWAMDNGIKMDIISFIAFKPALLFKFDPKCKDDAFPTPRTWALASHMTQGLTGKTDAEVEEEYITAATCIGEGAALEYQGFIKLKKRINIKDILDNPEKVNGITDVGLKYTLISGLAEKYRGDRKLLDSVFNVVNHMEKEKFGEEFAVFLLRLLKGTNEKYFLADIPSCKNWQQVFKDYSRLIFED